MIVTGDSPLMKGQESTCVRRPNIAGSSSQDYEADVLRRVTAEWQMTGTLRPDSTQQASDRSGRQLATRRLGSAAGASFGLAV